MSNTTAKIEHIAILHDVALRLMVLQNVLAQKEDNRISIDVEWGTRPAKISVKRYEWNDDHGIVSSDAFEWYYTRENAEAEKYKLISKVNEWEQKYGLL